MSRIFWAALLALTFLSGPAAAQSNTAVWSTGAGGNGHTYEIVLAPGGITWAAAQAAAESQGGYLATLTSAAENDFVFEALVNDGSFWTQSPSFSTGPWIGGLQPAGSPEPAGGWEWVNGEGPLAGGYTNWRGGEPNNSPANEDRILFFGSTGPFNGWNDAGGSVAAPSYVIEFAIPEPSTASLLVMGIALLSRRRRA